MKLRRSFRERIRWCKRDRLPGQTLKRKKWIVALVVLTAVFDWFLTVFGIKVILPNLLEMAPPYLPKKYAQEYTHISTLKGYSHSSYGGYGPVLAFSHNGKTVATDWRLEARVWDVETGEHLLTLETDMNQVRALAFYPDGKTVAGVIERDSSRGNYQFAVWDLTSPGRRPPHPAQHPFLGKKIPNISSKSKDALTPQANTSDDTTTAFTQDSANVITVGHSGSVWTLDLVQDRLLHQQVVGTKALKRMQFAAFHFETAPGDKINTHWRWGEYRYIYFRPPIVLSRQGTRSLSFLTSPTHEVKSLAFSPDGNTLASGGYNSEVRLWAVPFGEIRLWDVDTSRQIAAMPAPEGSVTALAFSPDGKTLASGSSWGKILIWDLASRRLVSVITERDMSIDALTFAPDSITLASVNGYGTVRLWDITGRTKR